MKKSTIFTAIFIMLISFITTAQNSPTEFGIKAGPNLSKYAGWGSNHEFQVGFYAGGFAAFGIGEKFQIQAELLFALQGSNYVTDDLQGGEFRRKMTETTISVPIVGRFFVSDKIYLEAGPQLGLILNWEEKTTHSSNPDANFFAIPDPDFFDFGAATGAGYKLTDKLTLSARYFLGLIQRDPYKIKSSVLNLGLEYKL